MASRSFVKYATLLVNLIVMLMSLVLLGLGIWILVDSASLSKLLSPSTAGSIDSLDANLVKNAGIAVTVVAGVSALTSFLGCCGAWKDNRCQLILFFTILTLIFIGAMMVAITSLVQQDVVKRLVEKVLNINVKHYVPGESTLYTIAANKYDCCGVVSYSACPEIYPGNQCDLNSPKCQKGCLDAVWNGMIMPYLNGIVAVLFLLSIVLLGGMFFSMCLVCTRVGGGSAAGESS